MTDLSDWIISNEPDFNVLCVQGEDAATFLHGQLTQDINHLEKESAVWCASCNYQGRVASTALVWRTDQGFKLLMPAKVAETELARLKKYVLRSKVTLELSNKPVTYLAAKTPEGANCGCPVLPLEKMRVAYPEGAQVISLPHAGLDNFAAKFVVSGDLPEMLLKPAAESEPALAASLIAEGMPMVSATCALEWLPQALNLDLIEGISFKKGCYTGQEVISKTQHLGRIKRRLYLASAPLVLSPKEALLVNGEPLAQVVGSAMNWEGIVLTLFVALVDVVKSGFTLSTTSGAPLKIESLPYEITVPQSVI